MIVKMQHSRPTVNSEVCAKLLLKTQKSTVWRLPALADSLGFIRSSTRVQDSGRSKDFLPNHTAPSDQLAFYEIDWLNTTSVKKGTFISSPSHVA